MASWLDELLDRGQEAKVTQRAEPAAREIREVWIQTRAPSGPGDTGGCEAGWYYLENSTVVMCDPDGKPTGLSERLTVGGNEKAVASRLRKRARTKEQVR
jgi:hypothetical protein